MYFSNFCFHTFLGGLSFQHKFRKHFTVTVLFTKEKERKRGCVSIFWKVLLYNFPSQTQMVGFNLLCVGGKCIQNIFVKAQSKLINHINDFEVKFSQLLIVCVLMCTQKQQEKATPEAERLEIIEKIHMPPLTAHDMTRPYV